MIGFLVLSIGLLTLLWFWSRGPERRVLVAALLVRLVLFPIVLQLSVPVAGTWSITPSSASDDVTYYLTAASIFEARSFEAATTEFAIAVNPGFFYLLGGLFLVFGKLWFIPHVLNLIAGVALPVAVIRLAGVLGIDRSSAVRAGWLTALLPTLVFFSVTGYKDMLTIFVSIMAILSISGLYRGGWSASGVVGAVFWTASTMALRLGLVPSIAAAFGLVSLRRLQWRGMLTLVLVAGVSAPPALAWWESAALTDYFQLAHILSQSGTESGMAAQVLQGGVATWPLRAMIFLLLPYPALSGVESAWDLYTWLNLCWYGLLAMAVPGAFSLWRSSRAKGAELGMLPVVFIAVVLFSLMVRGMPNMRYILAISPFVGILGAQALARRQTTVMGVSLLLLGSLLALPGYLLLRSSL